MKKSFWWVTSVLLIFSCSIISWKAEKEVNKAKKVVASVRSSRGSSGEMFTEYLDEIYNTAQLHAAGLNFAVFQKAVTGFYNLKAENKIPQYSSVITIVDLAKSSCTKRMWIVDLASKELVLNTWAAHGSGSGGDTPTYFSNSSDSHASSLGFYVTDGVYQGKHGRSLKLDGMDEGFNNNARSRSIVVHAAPYVSQASISELGRLGRSEGCPAVSPKVINKVIENIKGHTVLFINGNDGSYTSKYLNQDVAANYVYPASNTPLNASL